MSDRSTLEDQIDRLRQDLGAAEQTLETALGDSDLRRRVTPRFDALFSAVRSDLKKISGKVDQVSPTSPPPDWTSLWIKFGHARRDSSDLFRECIALLHGILGRRANLDNGLCGIADALLDDLSRRCGIPWGRFTILGDVESFYKVADVIRVRFPERAVWSLPLVTHEFGHYVANELRMRRFDDSYAFPFREFVTDEARNAPRESRYLHERFADMFATYTAGPAILMASVWLRFDPHLTEDAEHPRDAERVWFMLRTLSAMDTEGAIYRAVRDRVATEWNRISSAAGTPAEVTREEAASLESCFVTMYEWFSKMPQASRYDGWLRASRLSEGLRSPLDRIRDPEPEMSIADILNAAWQCRVFGGDAPVSIATISERALQACRIIGDRS
jgi:hypothetical protein